jgi:hypothetical protein
MQDALLLMSYIFAHAPTSGEVYSTACMTCQHVIVERHQQGQVMSAYH